MMAKLREAFQWVEDEFYDEYQNNQIEEESPPCLFLVGGAEDKINEKTILKKLIEISGGENAKILFVTAASNVPELYKADYVQAMEDLKHENFEVIHFSNREEAENPKNFEYLSKATAVFFTGGDQVRLMSRINGTRFHQAIIDMAESGDIVLAGTSAGAACMCCDMIYRENDENCVKAGRGLGAIDTLLARPVIIDTHCDAKNRLERLDEKCYECGAFGLALDEDTAILIRRDGQSEVIGSGCVSIIDQALCDTPIILQEKDSFDFLEREYAEFIDLDRRFH